MTRLEAAEMRFLRSVKCYTRLAKIRSEVIRKELEISGIQDVRAIYKQNWINHLERLTTPDLRNTSSTTNLEEEKIVDAPRNDGNASMPEKFKRPNPWRKMMMMMMNPVHDLPSSIFNLLKPNDIYICRTAALTSRCYILNIYSTNIHTEYFKHAA